MEPMPPTALGPQIMSNIIHLRQYVTITAMFLLWPSGQTKMEEVRIYVSNSYHPYWISHATPDWRGRDANSHRLDRWGNTLAHVMKSPIRIGLVFKTDLPKLLSALSSSWGLTLSSGCLPLWHQSNLQTQSSCLQPLHPVKETEGKPSFCWLALESEDISFSKSLADLFSMEWIAPRAPSWTNQFEQGYVTTPLTTSWCEIPIIMQKSDTGALPAPSILDNDSQEVVGVMWPLVYALTHMKLYIWKYLKVWSTS